MDEVIYNSLPISPTQLIYKYKIEDEDDKCNINDCDCNICIINERHSLERDVNLLFNLQASSIFENTRSLFDKYCKTELSHLNDIDKKEDVNKMLSYELELYPDYDLHHLDEKQRKTVWKDELPIRINPINPKEVIDGLEFEITPLLLSIRNGYKSIMKTPQYKVQKEVPMEYLKRLEIIFAKLTMPRQHRVHYLSQLAGQNFSYSVQYCVQTWEKSLIDIMQREKIMIKIKKMIKTKPPIHKFEMWTV